MNLWYLTLEKPPFTPPIGYFPIAWAILYSLMAIAFFLVITKPDSKEKYLAINLFLVQLILNFLWSYVFFDLQSIPYALADVILLFGFLLSTVIYFFKISKTAGYLLIPYLLQVIFAVYLTIGLAILNQGEILRIVKLLHLNWQ